MDGQNTNGYIRPFGEAKQPPLSAYDFVKDSEYDAVSPRMTNDRDWIGDVQNNRDASDKQAKQQPKNQQKHWYDEYPIEDRRRQLDECIK